MMLALAALLLLLPLATLAQSEPKDAVAYEIFVACPSSTNGRCPVQAWDGGMSLGSPAIIVDPYDVDNMMIASLHGGNAGSPEERSRSGLQFTTHVSRDHGASWQDMFYDALPRLPVNARGEHPGILMDPYGSVYVSSLYSIPEEDGNSTRFEYVISAQKFEKFHSVLANQDGSYHAEFVHPTFKYNRIGQTWYVYDQMTDNAVLLWNEQVTNGSYAAASDSQNFTVRGVLDEARRLVGESLPPAHAVQIRDADADTQTPRSLITWRWTTSVYGDPYHAPNNTIAPCATSTNPVVSEGWVYVGCVVAADQGPAVWNPNAALGEIHMFRFKPGDPEATYIGQAPVSGGQPKLGVRSDGRLALMTTEVIPAEANATARVRLDGVYGQIGPDQDHVEWGEVHQYGPGLQDLYAHMPLTEVNIQDMIYREYSGVIHMILKRVADWPQNDDYDYRPEFFKAIIAIDETYGVLDEIDLGIGDLAHRKKDSRLYARPASLHNDLSDDFMELPPDQFRYENRPLGESYQREFYAVGNYGIVDFAELIEVTELRGPGAAGLPNPPPPPNPAPAASANLALATAGALTASALTAGTAATMKRKSLVRAGRKK